MISFILRFRVSSRFSILCGVGVWFRGVLSGIWCAGFASFKCLNFGFQRSVFFLKAVNFVLQIVVSCDLDLQFLRQTLTKFIAPSQLSFLIFNAFLEFFLLIF